MNDETPPILPLRVLNTAPGFWAAYEQRVGHLRRRALLALFQAHPTVPLPVNNRYQASVRDPDLARLLKKGVLKAVRGGGARRHPLNRTSAKRQTYLILAGSP